jgi:DNA-binding winged helix-turn-helix (wHTH) protein
MTQIDILDLLVKNSNQTVAFSELFGELISGRNKDNLRMHLSDLKSRFKAVDESFDRIQSVPMIGYSWRV